MSTVVRRCGIWGVCALLLGSGCTAEDGGSMGDSEGSDGSSTSPTGGTAAAQTTTNAEDTGSSSHGGGDVGSGDPIPPDGSSGGASTGDGDTGSAGTDTGAEVVFDEEFVWVADFLRTNCVACHPNDVNGNLLLPSPDMTNDEVRLALEDVEATTGLLLVEPFDREASQTYLQITNEFGAQFSVEDTDRFGAWIDAGALYFVE